VVAKSVAISQSLTPGPSPEGEGGNPSNLSKQSKVSKVSTREEIYTVQVGAYSQRKWAEAMASRLKKRWKPVLIREQEIQGNGYFLVSVGRFSSKKAASTLADKLKKKERTVCVVRPL
jgi:cell division protein FtsN